MRGLKTDRIAAVVIEGQCSSRTLRRGHSELGIDTRADRLRCAAAFDELASMI